MSTLYLAHALFVQNVGLPTRAVFTVSASAVVHLLAKGGRLSSLVKLLELKLVCLLWRFFCLWTRPCLRPGIL